jgi:heme exporter protein D
VVYLPQIVYFVQSIKHTRKFMREMHERDVKERKEQEAREEMGRWK